MINKKVLLFSVFLGILLFSKQSLSQGVSDFNFIPGEKITYSVKKLGLRIGTSELIYNGIQKFKDQRLLLITFRTKVVKFKGEERIYLNPGTLLPVYVERDIDLMIRKEFILEEYDQKEHKVTITKTVGKKVTKKVIKKRKQIENIQGFIFKYRKQGSYKLEHTVEVSLPMSNVQLKMMRKEVLNIGDKGYESYYMEGRPRKLRVWFDRSKHHVPLRIDGKFGIGNVSLILDEYGKI